jgi:hypothetical protein
MPRIGTRRPRAGKAVQLTLGGLATLTLLGTAACGPSGSSDSSSPSSSAASPSGSASPRHQAMQAYVQCLSQHGVTLPAHHQPGTAPSSGGHHAPGTPPAGVDPQTWSAAQTACASVRPSRGPKS